MQPNHGNLWQCPTCKSQSSRIQRVTCYRLLPRKLGKKELERIKGAEAGPPKEERGLWKVGLEAEL